MQKKLFQKTEPFLKQVDPDQMASSEVSYVDPDQMASSETS